MIKRIYSSLLALVMVVGLLPTTAWAEVTAENDWNIFKTDDYSLPETQEQILQAMIQTRILPATGLPSQIMFCLPNSMQMTI